jgi:hypothetical protein
LLLQLQLLVWLPRERLTRIFWPQGCKRCRAAAYCFAKLYSTVPLHIAAGSDSIGLPPLMNLKYAQTRHKRHK